MIKNYFKTALRTLVKNRSYSAINISGLAISLAATILILLWVWDEWSYDRMHSKGDRIYTITATLDPNGEETWNSAPSAITYFAQKEIPDIEAAARINDSGQQLVQYGNKQFQEDIHHVDADFFQVFDFPFIAGERSQPFTDLHSVILTHSTARKYFGDAGAIGKIITINKAETFQVSAVIEDMPGNSSLDFGVMLPFDLLGENNLRDLNNNWSDFNYQTFLLLKPGSDAANVAKQLTQIHLENNNHYTDVLKSFSYALFPLFDIHLKLDNQRVQQVWMFVIIAMAILLIACINYINLVTARSMRRSREVGIRKVVGAHKSHLFWQFLTESLIVCIIAILAAFAISYAVMPLYNTLSGKDMVFSLLDGRIWVLSGAALVAMLLMAGVYPALTLSRFNPATALKGIRNGIGKQLSFREALVVLQFTCSVTLIVATITIGKQLNHIRQLDPGYDRENTLTFLRHNFRDIDAIRAALTNHPGILGVSASSSPLDDAQSITTSIDWEGRPASMNNFVINQISVDRDFINVMGIELIAGTGFTGTPADSTNYILNETAARQIGADVGTPISHQGKQGTVVAIAKDFHFEDAKTDIGPLILFMNPEWRWNHMYVRTASNSSNEAVAAVEELWKQYNADYDFNYTFMDETFDRQYREDIRTGQLFNIFAGIAILISCLGLFGLVTYTAETKVKEIGIRKTLGASVFNIITLISKDFLKLVLFSFLIAFPFGWWMMNRWLDNYAYRTTVEWWVFAVSGLTAFLIAVVTVCGKSLLAASENPIEAIRTE